jgi:LDH2 family malate/lactate/ureidoglycolate dehydrogenase
MNNITVPVSVLNQFVCQIFEQIGLNEQDQQQAAAVLLSADLRGVESHGLARLSGYIRLWEKKRINSRPNIQIVHELATTATVDGDEGLGLVVAPFAMDIAISKATQYGSAWVAVRNSNHFGIAAYHAMKALPHDMIGIAMTNASPLVAPTFSIERMLGTNPMCFAFPAKKYDPIVIDMATAAAANGKLEIAQRANKAIPEGWLQTKDGKASADPNELKKGGSLLPLGSDIAHGSHKGFGLSATVDILSAVLSGANFGPWVPPFVSFLEPAENPVGKGIGHFFGAIRIDGFRAKEDYYHAIDTWIERFKNAERKSAEQPVIIPGEPEMEAHRNYEKGGIPINEIVYNDLKKLAMELNVSMEF